MKRKTKDNLTAGLFVLFCLGIVAGVILLAVKIITPEVSASIIAGSFIATLGIMVFTFK